MNDDSCRSSPPESPFPPDVGAVLDGIFDQRVAFQLVRPSRAPLRSKRLRSRALRQVKDACRIPASGDVIDVASQPAAAFESKLTRDRVGVIFGGRRVQLHRPVVRQGVGRRRRHVQIVRHFRFSARDRDECVEDGDQRHRSSRLPRKTACYAIE